MNKIFIGYTNHFKKKILASYLKENPEIDEIVYFAADKLEPLDFETELPVERRTWSDAIMYKYFYPLLEKINHNTLIIYDEMMRVKKRNDLTYNCLHHYGNQTPHNLVFNYLPIIDEEEDYMILVDLAYPGQYKMEHCSDEMLKLSTRHRWHKAISCYRIDVSDEIKEKYKEEIIKAFDELGMKDPDTIPRRMSLWVTDKVKMKDTSGLLCREVLVRRERKVKTDKKQRTYKTNDDSVMDIMEFPNRQLEYNDFLRFNKNNCLYFINTGLSVDEMYYEQYKQFYATVDRMCNFDKGDEPWYD